MTEERALLLDRILSSASDKNCIVKLPVEKESDRNEYISAGHDLENLNLGKRLAEGDFMIFPDGLSFIREQSFIKLYKEEIRRKRKEKIEFWLKILGGVAAALGIIWGFAKSCS